VSRSLRCEFIDAEKTTYGVRRLCRVLAVSKTAYYDWVAGSAVRPVTRSTRRMRSTSCGRRGPSTAASTGPGA
jgi:hypothetical protein